MTQIPKSESKKFSILCTFNSGKTLTYHTERRNPKRNESKLAFMTVSVDNNRKIGGYIDLFFNFF